MTNPEDSDMAPLASPRITALFEKKRSWLRKSETMLLIAGLFLSGFGVGFVYKSRIDDALIAQQRDDHQREIARLQDRQANQLAQAGKATVQAANAVAAVTDQTAANTEAVTELIKKTNNPKAKP